jgi:cystathionine beta-lyase
VHQPIVPAPGTSEIPDFDLTDLELRNTGSVKWNHGPDGVLPAWVAEMDVRACPAVLRALREALDRSAFGYPPQDGRTGLQEATAAFLSRRFGWAADPGRIVLTGDVMAGIRLALDVLSEGGPVVVPVPAYPPFLDVVPLTGRTLALVPCVRDGRGRHALDLEAVDAALAGGARTVLLTNPHNPLGRAFDAEELAALRDTVLRHGARVISDDVHAPLVLPGARHVPYASLDGTGDHTTTVVAASKAWNIPGLKCAQIIAGSGTDLARLRSAPLVASLAAYTEGEPWLDGVLAHLARMRELFGHLLSERLPEVHWHPMEATCLAWLDARGTGRERPARAALDRGLVMVSRGEDFGGGFRGFVRVNLATSAERIRRVVDGLVAAWTGPEPPPRHPAGQPKHDSRDSSPDQRQVLHSDHPVEPGEPQQPCLAGTHPGEYQAPSGLSGPSVNADEHPETAGVPDLQPVDPQDQIT